MRRLFVLAALLFALPAQAANIVINNGLAPPNPANVIEGIFERLKAVNSGLIAGKG